MKEDIKVISQGLQNIQEFKLRCITHVQKPTETQLRINDARKAFNYILQGMDKELMTHKELFYVIFLHTNLKIIGFYKLSEGGINSCTFDQRLLFLSTLLSGATGLILCHNHPSGNPTPSIEDIRLTKNCRESGKLLGIDILDHLILTLSHDQKQWDYYSMANEGQIPS